MVEVPEMAESAPSLTAFLEAAYAASAEGFEETIPQAISLLENLCVHLPVETSNGGYDPIEALRRLLRYPRGSLREFYASLVLIFAEFGDRHTYCQLPPPFSNQVAFLPFVAREFFDGEESHFAVVHSAVPELKRGDLLISWNGVPVKEAVRQMMPAQLGANPEARWAKASQSLTFRPLAWLPPPDGQVVIETESDEGPGRKLNLDWHVTGMSSLSDFASAIFGGSNNVDWLNGRDFDSRVIGTQHGEVGYIRLASLHGRPEEFLKRFLNALDSLPSSGLILDLRGCREGVIPTSEQLLQLFTPRPVEPLLFQFRLTGFIEALVRKCPALSQWREPVESATRNGELYSGWRTLTSRDQANNIGRKYPGPVVLLTDALTYSSGEMLAAGFQDHGIGPVIGTAPRTGGGGASSWSQNLIFDLSRDESLRPSPDRPSFRVAVQRCRRTGTSSGALMQGSGVVPDVLHRPSWRDLFEEDADLIEESANQLARNRNETVYWRNLGCNSSI